MWVWCNGEASFLKGNSEVDVSKMLITSLVVFLDACEESGVCMYAGFLELSCFIRNCLILTIINHYNNVSRYIFSKLNQQLNMQEIGGESCTLSTLLVASISNSYIISILNTS